MTRPLPDAIATLLDAYPEPVRGLTLRLRDLVLEVMPEAIETTSGHKTLNYSTAAGVMKGGMAYIAPLKDSVNLGFQDGVDLPDPDGLLAGTGKRLRHVKFTEAAQIEARSAALRALLVAARDMKVDG